MRTAAFQKGIMKCQDYLFTFLCHLDVPYDNNGRERADRIIKVKQKDSGCFRTNEGVDAFMILHSKTEIAKKNGQSNCTHYLLWFNSKQTLLHYGEVFTKIMGNLSELLGVYAMLILY